MVQVFPTAEALADAVARHVAACAGKAISATGRFTLVLSGGSTPEAAYSRLAIGDRQLATVHSRPATRDSRLIPIDWRLVHVIWGDERCVPPDDPQSNYRMAREALLDRVPIPEQNIHRIRGEDEPERAAAEYERTLRTPSSDRLDLVLLGLGEDGHTASLFPGQAAVHETSRWVVAVLAPDKKLWRVTLTPAILNQARNLTFVVSGASKAARLQQVIEGPFVPDQLPAQAIRPSHGRLTWMVDEAAAVRLHPARLTT
jgi:6-phosphogluconolactonase